MDEQLRPCPFCGGQAHIEAWERPSGDITFGVYCFVCGAQSYQLFTSEQEAINAWNQRTGE